MSYEPIHGTLVVGFTGRARHGKDLACEVVAGAVRGARRYAFSDFIAAHARALGLMGARDPAVLQRVGYEARLAKPTVWLDSLYWAIRDHNPPLALVSGVRFPDEAELVRSAGGYIVRVERVGPDGAPFESGDRDQSYPTETAMGGIAPDYVVSNVTGRVDAFRDAVLSTYHAITLRAEEEQQR